MISVADAVFCGIQGRDTPTGYYNLESMLKGLRRGAIKACGGCMKARGLKPERLLPGIAPSNMQELADWTFESDKVIVF